MEACTMHVEFRIASVDSMISFDAESFIRMHQIKHLPLHGPQRRHSLVKLPHGGVNFTNDFRPRIQLQFVLENHVRIQSSPIKDVVPSAGQGEMEKWRWDASDIRTRRYYSKSSQAIVTSLPRKFVNREVKIRLLQLAPDLDKAERDIVEASFPEYSQLEDTSLCLGVARISLKDLIVTSSGVSVALQPKRGMMKAVEGLNLNTIETNAIFGRDGGGSGVVVFQVVSIVFNPRSFSFLLHSKHPGDGVAPSLLLDNGRTDSTVHTPSPSINGFDGAPSSVAEARRQMNSGVVRFVLVPYMALVDAVLRYNDALSWRNPIKTSVLLCIMWIMISTEMVDLGLVLAVAFEAASVFRTMTFFCRVPPYMNTGCNSVEFSAERVGSFQAVLYGSHNHVINSMVRARLFFTQGLQADCYFELVYLSYRLRKLTRNTLWYIALLVLGSCVVSIETLALLGVLFAFFVHPLLLRASFSRLRKTWRRQLASGTFWKGIALSRPMTVTRVVQVDIPQERSAWPRSLTGLARFPVHHGTDECKTKCELLTFFPHERTGSGVKDNETGSIFCLDSPRQKLAVSSPPAESSTTCIGARNLSLFGGSSAHLPNILSRSFLWKHDAVKHDQQGVQDLTFVVIVITNEHPSSNGAKSVGPPNVGTPLLQRLHRVLQRANSLERPPPVNMLGAHYQLYFNGVFTLLQFLGRQCTLDAYMTMPSTALPPPPSAVTVKLDQLVPSHNLVELGDDDSITPALMSHAGQQIVLNKLQPLNNTESSARALALLAAYLLQGSRLSIFNGPGSKTCSIIVPLNGSTNGIEVVSEPHPCPPSLQKALVGFWEGLAEGECSIDISTDVVLKIISTYKDAWTNYDGNASSTQEYSHMTAGQPDECNPSREASKRILQPFDPATNFSKRFSVGRMNRSSLLLDDKPPLLRPPSALPDSRANDTVPIGGYHRATRTWA